MIKYLLNLGSYKISVGIMYNVLKILKFIIDHSNTNFV